MAQILVTPQDLESRAEQLRSHVQRIQAAIDAIDRDINSLNTSQFEGHRATELRTRYTRYRDYLYAFKPMTDRFSAELEMAAARFRAADS